MKQKALELEKAITSSQESAKILHGAGAPHGTAKHFKKFWGKDYMNIQETAAELVELVELYEQQGYNAELPFTDEAFHKTWSRYLIYIYEETGNQLSRARAEIQLDLVAKHYAKSEDAVEALKYIINRGYKHIFKVNPDDASTAKTTETKAPSADEFE